ncbi:hypothetical protein H0H87_005479 [Tephrocybe sp. NHM501043]|nr:hypothetical protein H0H87_005479 [Tephrocybe sp. NHM501043]
MTLKIKETPSLRLPEATEGIEDMVISFLSQLASFGRRSRDHSESDLEEDSGGSKISGNVSKCHRKKAQIELQLVDRSKPANFGSTSMKPIGEDISEYMLGHAKQFVAPLAQLLRVLDVTHEAVIDDTPATKRDIYYRDIPLFKSQRTVDSLVDDIAATLALERSDLNIRASSKGLVSGSGLDVHLRTGETVRVNDTEGTLIPVGEDIKSLTVDPRVAWVLIVEKDASTFHYLSSLQMTPLQAVFQTLCRLKVTCHESLPHGLIITGKGYPDVATRNLVKSLADLLPGRIPILALVDGDPYGLDILSVYKFGSRSLQHESCKLAASRIVWLGLWSSELANFGIDRDRLLPITKHDEAKVCSVQTISANKIVTSETKALSMLQRSLSTMPTNWRKELMHMLHFRRKAEIEILYTSSTVPRLQESPAQASVLDNHDISLTTGTLDLNNGLGYDTDIIPAGMLGIHTSTSLSSTIPMEARCHSLFTAFASTPSSPQPIVSEPSHASLLRYLMCKIGQALLSASVEHPT